MSYGNPLFFRKQSPVAKEWYWKKLLVRWQKNEWLNQGADKQQELLLLKYLHWQEILEHCDRFSGYSYSVCYHPSHRYQWQCSSISCQCKYFNNNNSCCLSYPTTIKAWPRRALNKYVFGLKMLNLHGLYLILQFFVEYFFTTIFIVFR
jgi:hypothetical protein